MRFTAIYVQGDDPSNIVAFCAEVPTAIAEGKTMEEARADLIDAIQAVTAANRATLHERLAEAGKTVILREEILA